MTVTQEELILRAQGGDRQAGEQLVVENSGLIWSIARRYFGRGVDPDDLYQLGCVGFLKAIAGFDVSVRDAVFDVCRPEDGRRDPALSPR